VLLDWLPHLGQLKAVTAMTFALLLACAITRRWRGAVLTALAVPIAIGITDYVLKPTVGEAIGGQPAAARTSRATSSCRATSGGAPGRIPGPAAAAHAVVTSGSRPPCPPLSRCPWSVTTTIVQFSSGPDGRERTAATSRPTR
jgi:hypothetical protein